jgi:hypothetical protein
MQIYKYENEKWFPFEVEENAKLNKALNTRLGYGYYNSLIVARKPTKLQPLSEALSELGQFYLDNEISLLKYARGRLYKMKMLDVVTQSEIVEEAVSQLSIQIQNGTRFNYISESFWFRINMCIYDLLKSHKKNERGIEMFADCPHIIKTSDDNIPLVVDEKVDIWQEGAHFVEYHTTLLKIRLTREYLKSQVVTKWYNIWVDYCDFKGNKIERTTFLAKKYTATRDTVNTIVFKCKQILMSDEAVFFVKQEYEVQNDLKNIEDYTLKDLIK